MIRKIFKEFGIPLLIIGILYFTGYLSDVAAFGQRIVLGTGILNASTEISEEEILDFDYNATMTDAQGNLVSLEEFKGKVIFLNIWASWCPPCKAEMPGIEKLYADMQDREDVAFIMLSMDRNEHVAANYVKRYEYHFPWYHAKRLNPQLQVPSLPTTLVISKKGKVIYEHVGMARYNTKGFKKFLERQAKK